MGHRPQRVHRPQWLDLEGRRVEHGPLDAAVDRDRKHQHRRLGGRRHRARLAADHQGLTLPGRREVRLDRIGGDGLARCQRGEHLRLRIMRGDECARDRRRDERPGGGRIAELGDDHRELHQARTLAVDGLGQVQTLQTLFGRRAPVDGRILHGRFECRVQHLGRDQPAQQ